MVRQERAERTRRVLVAAAAGEFDRAGFEGTSLARVRAAAGISMGALTFHFPTKDALAQAVQGEGMALACGVVEKVRAQGGGAVQGVVALTLELAGLLESEALVRAAARLARERGGVGGVWCGVWAPVIEELLQGAGEEEFGAVGDRVTLAALAAHLVTGAEALVRCRLGGPGAGEGGHVHGEHSAREQLAEIWALVMRGLNVPPAAP
ncbi:TetR family transcriptional regulator [Streptomyces purpureus]|uniref:TetR family transcriptional regulator n=1 Tax=Streptomyces purpureus TaxID=1951 RepID=UPI001670A611